MSIPPPAKGASIAHIGRVSPPYASSPFAASAAPPPPIPDPTPPARTVWHRKSKQGCKTCKLRKVKCDETRPLCRNCARRFPGIESCDFARPPPPGGPDRIPHTPSSSSSASAAPTSSSLPQSIQCRPAHVHESNKMRLMELRLMYHYTRTVHTHLPHYDDPRTRLMWEVDIPQAAFSSELVLSAVMALSALHLRMLTPGDKDLAYASGHYFGAAVRRYRPVLSNLTPEMAEQMLITAMIITYYTWLVSYSPSPAGTPYQLPLQNFFLLRGVFDLLREVGPWIKSPNFMWLYTPLVEVEIEPDGEEVCWFLREWARDRDRFSTAIEADAASGEISSEDVELYGLALGYVSQIITALCTAAPARQVQRKISYFVPRMPRRFLDLLAMRDPRAMALLARDLALLRVTDWAWWLHGCREAGMQVEMYHVRGIAELMPVEWLWSMEWPLRVAGGGLRLDSGDVDEGVKGPVPIPTVDGMMTVPVSLPLPLPMVAEGMPFLNS